MDISHTGRDILLVLYRHCLILIGAVLYSVCCMGLSALHASPPSSHQLHATYQGAFGVQGSSNGALLQPSAISVDLQGNIYIADTGNNRIQKFSSTGKFLRATGGFGWQHTEFNKPVDVFARLGLQVYVCDYLNERIVQLDRNLNFIAAYQLSGRAPARITSRFFPVSLVRNAYGDIFVLDRDRPAVAKYQTFTTSHSEFAEQGTGVVQLNDPVQLAVSANVLYVADQAENCIRSFDFFGNYLQDITLPDAGQPAGLDVDEQQRLWICDSANKHILCFDSEGIVTGLLDYRNSDGNLSSPIDVAVYKKTVYVLDNLTGTVHIFHMVQQHE